VANPIFDLIVVIDWSAANSPGPTKPSPDRCWISWIWAAGSASTEYFRTRNDCMRRLLQLTLQASGNVLLSFDFPMGYPAGSALKGGRAAAAQIAIGYESDEKDKNNRFERANDLNRALSQQPGPFWGCPKAKSLPHLSSLKPPFQHSAFNEWRQVEARLKADGHRIMNVWQLLGQGSVGSQTLTGLAALHSFSQGPQISERLKYWPMETNWSEQLDGIIIAEIWPSLIHNDHIDHPIKDARQVTATRDHLKALQDKGSLIALFKEPDGLSRSDLTKVQTEEGWILGA
jgi:hypothetical protein